MKINYPKKWFEQSANIEGNSEIGAGRPIPTASQSKKRPQVHDFRTPTKRINTMEEAFNRIENNDKK